MRSGETTTRQTQPRSTVIPTPTDAQNRVCRAISSGKSVCVLAHAGTGKTSVMLHAVALAPASATLFLEYNRSLKDELRRLVDIHDLKAHITAENYDSFLTGWYDRSAPVSDFDLALLRVLQEDTRPLRPVTFERLVIDEAQDLTFDFVSFVKKLLKDNTVQPSSRVQIVLVGDSRQAINGFRGASALYLEKASETFQRSFVTLRLPETFRFGQGLCETVNSVVGPLFGEAWNGDVVSGCLARKTEVTLWRGFDEGVALESDAPLRPPPRHLLDTYQRLLETSAPEETIVLLTRSLLYDRSPGLWDFVGKLNASDVLPTPVLSEHCSPTDDPRVCIGTIHASKGRTFDHCFLFMGSDWGSGRQRGRKMDAESMRVLYVAMTRAKRHLHIVDDGGVFEQLLKASDLSSRLPEAEHIGEDRGTSLATKLQASGSCRDLAAVLAKGLKVEARAKLMAWLERQLSDPFKICGEDDLLSPFFGASGTFDEAEESVLADGANRRVPVVVACAFQLWAARRVGFDAHPTLELLRERHHSPHALAETYQSRTRQSLPSSVSALLSNTPPLPQAYEEMDETKAEIFVRLATLHEIFRFGQVAPPPSSGDASLSQESFDVKGAATQVLELMIKCPPLCLAGYLVAEIPGLDRDETTTTDMTEPAPSRPPRRLGIACPDLLVMQSPGQVLLLVVAFDVLPQLRHVVMGLYVASALRIKSFRVHYVGSERHFDFEAPRQGAECVDLMLRNKRRRTS